MANRKLPFGYEMRLGTICIKAVEAPIVKEIYAAYSEGMSYRQIMNRLNTQTVPYHEPGKPWNKNMVARILSNELYTGNESYPAILSCEEYRLAVSAKPITGSPLDTSRQSKTIRQLARCAVCGGKLSLSDNKYGWARWNCSSCNAISADAVMPDTIAGLSHILTAVIKNPDLVRTPPQMEQSMQSTADQLENEFNLVFHTEKFDESAAKTKAISLASARFDALGSKDYETMRIQYILNRTKQNSELDAALLRQIISAILIHPTGTVSLKLKNGQIMNKE